MTVVKIVDRDVSDKVDTQYIARQLADIQNVGIIYVCTPDGEEDDDWVDDKGKRHIMINLPYKQVKNAIDIKPLMLMRAKEKLGLVA